MCMWYRRALEAIDAITLLVNYYTKTNLKPAQMHDVVSVIRQRLKHLL